MRGATRSYYLFDGLGSVVAVTNANGGVTNSYTYDPYGATTETKAALTNVFNPWRYVGQYHDVSTGLYKMGARYYQSELGRWTQPDPSGRDANAYAYVSGNPVNFVDPAGLFGVNKDEIGAAISAALSAVGLVFPTYRLLAFAAESAVDIVRVLAWGSDCEVVEIVYQVVENAVTQLAGRALQSALETAAERSVGNLIDHVASTAISSIGLEC